MQCHNLWKRVGVNLHALYCTINHGSTDMSKATARIQAAIARWRFLRDFITPRLDVLVIRYRMNFIDRGVEQLVAREAHNLKAAGSSPAPATFGFSAPLAPLLLSLQAVEIQGLAAISDFSVTTPKHAVPACSPYRFPTVFYSRRFYYSGCLLIKLVRGSTCLTIMCHCNRLCMSHPRINNMGRINFDEFCRPC